MSDSDQMRKNLSDLRTGKDSAQDTILSALHHIIEELEVIKDRLPQPVEVNLNDLMPGSDVKKLEDILAKLKSKKVNF